MGFALLLYEPEFQMGRPVVAMAPVASRRYLPCGSWQEEQARLAAG